MPPKLNPSPDFAPNQSILADRLGVSRRTISAWRRKGAPEAMPDGRWNVLEWEEWRDENQPSGESGGSEMDPLKLEKMREQVRKLRIENDRTEAGLVDAKELREATEALLGMLIPKLDAWPDHLATATSKITDYYELKEVMYHEVEELKRFILKIPESFPSTARV